MTSHTVFTRIAIVALASVGLTATLSYAATPDSEAQSVSVSYSDLNLSTAQGTRVLHERIAAAARQVCPSNVGPSARQLSESRHCVAAAMDRALSEVNNPQLAKAGATHTR